MLDFETKLKPNDYWQTPKYITDAVNELWPAGWMDPCPANPKIDALSYNWCQPAYVNPPFSEYKMWAIGGCYQNVEQVWIMHHDHSTERFRTLCIGATAMCLLFERVCFIDPITGESGDSPAKCQTLIYRPSTRADNTQRFKETFKRLGFIVELV